MGMICLYCFSDSGLISLGKTSFSLLLEQFNQAQLHADLVSSQGLGVLCSTSLLRVKEALERTQDIVRGNMQEEGRRDAPEGTIVRLVLDNFHSGLVDNDLMVSGLHNTSRQPLQLLSCLDLEKGGVKRYNRKVSIQRTFCNSRHPTVLKRRIQTLTNKQPLGTRTASFSDSLRGQMFKPG